MMRVGRMKRKEILARVVTSYELFREKEFLHSNHSFQLKKKKGYILLTHVTE